MRREDTTDEREIPVERDRVPKMTSHFESFAEKLRAPDVPGEEGRKGHVEKPKFDSQEERDEGKNKEESSTNKRRDGGGGGEGGEERSLEMHEREGGNDEEREWEGQRLSLEEISKYRAIAQQNALEAIRAAEERYAKATAYASEKLASAKDSLVAAEEKAKEYTSPWKKAEVEKDSEAKKSAESKGGTTEEGRESQPSEEVPEVSPVGPEFGRMEQQGGGVLQAVGETLVEIAQTAKELLIGLGPGQWNRQGGYEGYNKDEELDQKQGKAGQSYEGTGEGI